jgi:predicted nucleic acid-binding protein
MIVADTCLVVHLFNETLLTDIAQKIQKKDASWILPPLWQEEYANVLSKLARKESRDVHEVIRHFSYVLDELRGSEIIIDSRKALKISIEYKISVYDAHFVGLALDFDVTLVTEDKEVLKNCRAIACSMRDFLKKES